MVIRSVAVNLWVLEDGVSKKKRENGLGYSICVKCDLKTKYPNRGGWCEKVFLVGGQNLHILTPYS